MKSVQSSRNLAALSTERQVDPITLQTVVERRLALRLGVSVPVAAAIAALAGLGPQAGSRA